MYICVEREREIRAKDDGKGTSSNCDIQIENYDMKRNGTSGSP